MNKFLEITADGQDMAAMLKLLQGHGYQASDVTDEISESAVALRRAEQKYLDLVDNAPIGIFRSTEDGKLISVNPAMARMFKYESPEEMIRMVNLTKIAETLYEDPARRRELMETVLQHKGWQVFEERFRCRDGSVIICNFHYRAVPCGDNMPQEFEGFIVDITGRKLVETRLLLTQYCVDQAPVDIALVTPVTAKIIYANDFMCRSLGYSAEELASMTSFDLDPSLNEERIAELDRQFFAKGFIPLFESCHRRKDGTVFPIEMVLKRIMFENVDVVMCFAQDISKRKQAETMLKEQLHFLQQLLDSIPIPVFFKDAGGLYLGCNSAYERFFGVSRSQLVGKTVYDVAPKEQADIYFEADSELFNNQETQLYETRIDHNDGSRHDVIFNKAVFFDAEGCVAGIVGAIVDITERRRAEETLRRSEERFRSLVETSSDWIWEVDVRGVYTYSSPNVADILGYDPQEVMGKTPFDLMSPEEAERMRMRFVGIVASGTSFHGLENVNLHRNGHEVIIETNGVPIFGVDGELCGYRGIDRDITERKRAEEALMESEEKFRVLAETSPSAIALYQGEEVIYINPTATRLLGYSIEELSKMSFWGCVHDDFQGMVRERVLARLRGEPMPSKYECKLVTKDGRELWAIMSIGLMEFKGKPAGIVTLMDTTEAKLAEERIRSSLAEKEVLLKEVHHRVKNNLQIISSLLDLQSEFITDLQLRGCFLESQNRIRSMALIHERLYGAEDFASIDFEEYVKDLSRSLFESYVVDPRQIYLELDAGKISLDISRAIPCGLIINELVSNSLKHAFPDGRSGEISIRFKADADGWITLEIADTGVGLPAGLDFRNTGTLGLELVNLLAQQLRGEVAIRSSPGTRFIVRFPDRPGR